MRRGSTTRATGGAPGRPIARGTMEMGPSDCAIMRLAIRVSTSGEGEQAMAREFDAIDVSDTPESLRLAEEVHLTNEPRVLRRGGRIWPC